MKKYIIVLNMGMKSIRSIVYGLDGEKVGSASLPIETFLDGERVTQDPSEWWEKAKLVVSESVKDIGTRDICYITVTASSSCLVCVDKNVTPLEKCIMVSDKRAVSEAQQMGKMAAFFDVKQETGLSSDSYFMLPKILWVKNNWQDIYARTYKCLSPDDFLIAKLTGKFVTDTFNAQKYYYNINTCRYPEQLCRELKIKIDLLPQAVNPGTEIGCLTEKAGTELGLNSSVKVIVASYDAICSFFGSGVSEEGEASDASGTVTALRALSYQEQLLQNHKIFNLYDKKRKMNIVGGSNNLGGGLVEWVKQCYYQNEVYPYEVMEKDAYDAGLGAGGLIFLPYLLGERAPVWNHDARGVFFGLERSHTRKEMTRAVFESTGFIALDMINAIEETGVKVPSVRLSGGLARINLISQIKADILGRQVSVINDFETTACGAAMMALLGVGIYKNLQEVAEKFVSVRMIVNPIQSNHEKYMKLYKLYKETYSDLTNLFQKRMSVMKDLYPKHEIRIANM